MVLSQFHIFLPLSYVGKISRFTEVTMWSDVSVVDSGTGALYALPTAHRSPTPHPQLHRHCLGLLRHCKSWNSQMTLEDSGPCW
ncbi:hypothetical protein SLEP1_g11748 [Rubroshorea leprosula]|nr:hypothetical protein SLEP1_g11748 [Rubroshorea leprosula]